MENKVWKPTRREIALIKIVAGWSAEMGANESQIRLEPGYRVNCDVEDAPIDINEWVVDPTRKAETDLHDCGDWSTFTKGVTLDETGAAEVDFYIRPKTDAIEDANQFNHLLGNVVVRYENGQISAIFETGPNPKNERLAVALKELDRREAEKARKHG